MSLMNSIKKNEGFSEVPYIDPLVAKNPNSYGITDKEFEIIKRNLSKLKLTFGYGMTYITEDAARLALGSMVDDKIRDLISKEPYYNELPQQISEVIAEMCWQMGVNGVLNFKKMWIALKNKDYEEAAKEMLDSRWANQTPQRAKELSDIIKSQK